MERYNTQIVERSHVRAGPPVQPLAVDEDGPAIAALMRALVLALFGRVYDKHQTASAAVHIAHVDELPTGEGTFFFHVAGDEIVACGGWSRRAKLCTGSGAGNDDARLRDPESEPAHVRAMFVRSDWTYRGLGRAILGSCECGARTECSRNVVLGATLPGEPRYRSVGLREVARFAPRMAHVGRVRRDEASSGSHAGTRARYQPRP